MKISAYQREILYRRGNCKRNINKYSSKIESFALVCVQQLEFLGLEESDRIFNCFSGVEQLHTIKAVGLAPKEINAIIRGIKNEYAGLFYIFIDTDWEYCGTFCLDSNLIRADFHFSEITDDIILISKDLSKRINLEYYEHRGNFFIDLVKARKSGQI